MRRSMGALTAVAASAVLFLAAAPEALGVLGLPDLASATLDEGVNAVLATVQPNRKQVAAMNRIEKLLRPGRRVGAMPHRSIIDAKRIDKAIGNRFDVEIGSPTFHFDVCNEIGGWVERAMDDLDDDAVAAGRRDETRIARAFAKAEKRLGQAVDARNHANGPKTLAKMAQAMKQLQKVAKFLGVDVPDL